MISYLLVAIGGASGAMARFTIGRLFSTWERKHLPSGMEFPIGTFLINLTGAFLLGVVSTLGWTGNLYALVAEGFLGAYTTFSTLMHEGYFLFRNNDGRVGTAYLAGSILLGVLSFFMGGLLVTLSPM